MQLERSLSRVRLGALILMIAVAAETIRYTWKSFHRAWRFCFGEPERWNTHWMVDEGAVIETSQRLLYFSIWSVIILASIAAFLAGLHLLNRVRRGQIFTQASANAIRRLGAVLAFAMFLDMIFQAMDAWLITYSNAENIRPIAWFYDPSDIKTFFMAVILFLFGWVMQQSLQVERENRGFV